MASQIQLVMYEGFLGEAPEMRYTANGKNVTNFRIASNKQYTNFNGEKVKETTWLRVSAWGKLGELVNDLCDKGSHVIVTGVLKVGENGSPVVYKMKNDTYGASYEITASSVRIIKGKERTEQKDEAIVDQTDEENIPF